MFSHRPFNEFLKMIDMFGSDRTPGGYPRGSLVDAGA
jgi:hypothetical protein